MGDKQEPLMMRFLKSMRYCLEQPVIFVREKLVEPNQKKYPWYHQQYKRVPTIDECYTDDFVCHFEANVQYQRDRQIDMRILTILRDRYEDCCLYNDEDRHVCDHLWDTFEAVSGDWMSQHGDLGPNPNVRDALMKQKHRMIWERRHGPIGSGMKTPEAE